MSQLMTTDEVAKWLRVHPRTIRLLSKNGKLPCIKMERKVRYETKDVEAYIASSKQGSVNGQRVN